MSGDDVSASSSSALAHQQFAEAYTRFVGGLQAAVGSPEQERSSAEAYDEYSSVMADALAAPEVQQRVAAAWTEYLTRLQSAFSAPEARDGAARSYTRYVEDVQSAWAQIDPSALDATALAGLGQALTSAAWLAGAAEAAAAEGAEWPTAADWGDQPGSPVGSQWTGGGVGLDDPPQTTPGADE